MANVAILNRAKLAQVFKDPETLRAFEAVLQGVSTTLPADVTVALLTANDARSRAITAQSEVDALEILFADTDALVKTGRDRGAEIHSLMRRIEDLEARLLAAERNARRDYRREIEDLQTLVMTAR
jgi:hypothetical protein